MDAFWQLSFMNNLPLLPVGRFVLLLLDRDDNLNEATVAATGHEVPTYREDEIGSIDACQDRRHQTRILKIGDRVRFNKDLVVDEYTDEPSAEEVASYEPKDEDEQDDIPPKYALVHVDGIYAIINKHPNKK